MKKWISRLTAPFICLVFTAVFFGEIYFFRPPLFRQLPKYSWFAAALLCGIPAGLGLAAIFRRIGRRIPAPGYTAAILLLLTGAAVLLPGPHHPNVVPNALSAVSLQISLLPAQATGEATIQNISIDEKRVDWPSACSISGSHEQKANQWLVLRKTAGPKELAGEIRCVLYPPKAGSQVSIYFGDPAEVGNVEIRLGDQSLSGNALNAKVQPGPVIQISTPITPGIAIARVLEFLATLLILLLLIGIIYWTAASPAKIPTRAVRLALQICLFTILAGMVILTNLTDYSFIKNIESKDAGVFLYMGQAILSGKMPYVDVWDHKPPLVFYLNALGLALSNGSAWGVWGLEVFLLVCSGWILYCVIRRHAGAPGAIAGILLWVTGLFLLFRIDETNVPETWGIFFQAASLWVIDQMVDDAKKDTRLVAAGLCLVGVLGGLLFLLKQTLISLDLALLLILLAQTKRSHTVIEILKRLSWFALGAGLSIATALLYFWTRGALGDFMDAAFFYNLFYISTPSAQFAGSLFSSLFNVLWPVAGVAYIGWAWGVFRALKTMGQPKPLVFQLVLVSFPIEILISALSGKNFDYYFNARLYCIALLGGCLTGALLDILRTSLEQPASRRFREQAAPIFGMVYLCLMAILLGYSLSNTTEGQPGRNTHILTLEYIQGNTTPDEAVLLWGNEAALNFYSRRESPTRYFYQYPLFTCGYLNAKRADQFYEDLTHAAPSLIVDTIDPLLPGLDEAQSEAGFLTWAGEHSCARYSNLWKSMDFIQQHYQFTESIGRWKIYRLAR